jgi:ADP-dependent NAD(P)H-hydrate dehydratase / NAD(P)H-hydrate epimerase
MRNAHTVATVRAAEQALMAAAPEGALMQRAAAGLASVCAGLLGQVYGSHVVVLAGGGDNGGDALFAGARLARRGAAVVAVTAADRLHRDGAADLSAAGGQIVAAIEPGDDGRIAEPAGAAIGAADLIIDGLTGIGGHGGLREPAASLALLADIARRDGAVVVAVDLPSGIDANTGEVHGPALFADVTVTFGTWKPGLLIDPGATHTGAAELIDIGLTPYLSEAAVAALQAADVAAVLPQPTAESDKYRRGVLGVLAGSERYTGAAVLCVGGAIRGGAGMVRLVSAPAALEVVRQHWPEAVLTQADDTAPAKAIEAAGQVQAWTAGPGLGTGPQARDSIATVLGSSLPVLVDADGLTVLAAHRDLLPRSAPTLITPHAGELARLLRADRSDIEARRLYYARTAADGLGITVLLKGSTTAIAAPDAAEPVLVNPTGTSWLATAGSGDVLSGLAGAMLAQGLPPLQAAAAAAYLHGLAGRLAARDAPIGAADVLTALPDAIRAVTDGNEPAGPSR